MALLSGIFYWLFNMSISASVVGTVVLLLAKVKKLPRRIVHLLLAIPFLRMLIPVGMSQIRLDGIDFKLRQRPWPYDGALDFTFTNYIMAKQLLLLLTRWICLVIYSVLLLSSGLLSPLPL